MLCRSMFFVRLVLGTFVSVLLMFGVNGANAESETYPSKVVKIVVGFPAGGLTDVYARSLARHLEEKLGEPVIVENKPGAGTIIAAQTVARAEPDGHTLCFCVTAVSTNRFLRPDVSVGMEDFTPIALAFTSTTLLALPADSSIETVQALVDYGIQHPGELSYSTTGAGGATHLLGEMFTVEAGMDAVPIHYQGAVPSGTALATNEVDYVFLVPLVAQPLLKDGRIRLLATASKRRMPLFPDLPTMAESGFPGVDNDVWFGLLAPKGVPADIVELLNKETNAFFSDEATRERLSAGGDWPRGDLSPEEFGEYIEKNAEWHRELIERIDLTLE